MDVKKSYSEGTILTGLSEPGLGRIILNRPEKRNALTDALWRAIPDAIDWLVTGQNVRVIVIEGAGGRDFSAGADIGEFDTLRKDATSARSYEAGNAMAFAAIRNAPVPVLAAIRGICFGGGFGLAAAADLRIADETARFAVPAARLGLAYPVDAMIDLVRALGDQQARHALYTGKEFSAEHAKLSGCLLSLCAPDALDREATELARALAKTAPLSVRASKAAIAAQASGTEDDWRNAKTLADATFESRDYAEGRAAFRDRRAPDFTGL
ncbi:MAG: enoyl-CoA hydratase-related protein [Hoeflea sp.]|uniref:enoyl-CoA hydratase-related protein n=1 Tax=Hoeflea sp. TaxID=1940281 RepID=UPI0032F03812